MPFGRKKNRRIEWISLETLVSFHPRPTVTETRDEERTRATHTISQGCLTHITNLNSGHLWRHSLSPAEYHVGQRLKRNEVESILLASQHPSSVTVYLCFNLWFWFISCLVVFYLHNGRRLTMCPFSCARKEQWIPWLNYRWVKEGSFNWSVLRLILGKEFISPLSLAIAFHTHEEGRMRRKQGSNSTQRIQET